MTTYAKNTKCPVGQSQGEIQAVLARYGGDNFSFEQRGPTAIIRFQADGHRLRFHMPVPWDDTTQEAMSAWRSLLLVIKAKLQSVESGIEAFEEAFLAQIETSEGRTIGEEIIPTLSKTKSIACPYCEAINRLPLNKSINETTCGRCHRPLATNRKPRETGAAR